MVLVQVAFWFGCGSHWAWLGFGWAWLGWMWLGFGWAWFILSWCRFDFYFVRIVDIIISDSRLNQNTN